MSTQQLPRAKPQELQGRWLPKIHRYLACNWLQAVFWTPIALAALSSSLLAQELVTPIQTLFSTQSQSPCQLPSFELQEPNDEIIDKAEDESSENIPSEKLAFANSIDTRGVRKVPPSGTAVSPKSSKGPPPFKPLRFDEDYSYLKDPAKRSDCCWDSIKYVPMDRDPRHYLSIGGEVRERIEVFHNPDFGAGPSDSRGFNIYPTQRYMLHADYHVGPHLRFFTQTVTGLEYGAVGGPRRQTDFNEFGFHQAFVDLVQSNGDSKSDDSLTWRIGRQEMLYGSGRLIDVREGANLRLSFDAARFLARKSDWAVDGFWSRPVLNNPYGFDDIPDPQRSLWGLYAVHPLDVLPDGHIDLYYLGYTNEQARFNQGLAYERRNTIGTRIWGGPMPFEYNIECMSQFGRFGDGAIQAWSIATAVRYNFSDQPFRPRLGLRSDVASGDHDANSSTLQSFNPLFPSGIYFNLADPVGPINMIDFHPNLDLWFTDKLKFTADWNFFWRQSLGDGIYSLSGRLFRTAGDNLSRYVANTPSATLVWTPTRHISVLTGYVHVFSGPYIQQTSPSLPTDYFTSWIDYKF